MISSWQKIVYQKLRQVPKGKVTTYQMLAKATGNTRAARAIGNALNKNPDAPRTPCHRVIRSDGSLGGYALGQKNKIKILKKEGVEIKRGRVDLKRFGYRFGK